MTLHNVMAISKQAKTKKKTVKILFRLELFSDILPQARYSICYQTVCPIDKKIYLIWSNDYFPIIVYTNL